LLAAWRGPASYLQPAEPASVGAVVMVWHRYRFPGLLVQPAVGFFLSWRWSSAPTSLAIFWRAASYLREDYADPITKIYA
jgi:hypothetical protein